MERRGVKIILGVIVAIAVLWLINYVATRNRGTLEIKLNDINSSTQNVTTVLSSENYEVNHKLPYKTLIKAGDYTVIAWGTGTQVFQEKFTVAPRENKQIVVTLLPATSVNTDETSDDNNTAVPYLDLFPYVAPDFRIDAETNSNTISKLDVTLYLTTPTSASQQEKDDERNLVVSEVQKWLNDQKIPNSIPVNYQE